MGSESRLVIGLMSGTSLDAVDAALIETDGESHIRALAFADRPYSYAERDLLRAATARALEMPAIGPDPLITAAETLLTHAHAEAIAALPGAADATLIGFHGQTVAHRPPSSGHPAPFTWQIGDAALLVRLTGRPVVSDFRSGDVAAGGEGAPLAPGFHRALVAGLGISGPVAVLNIGGVGNITWFEDATRPDAAWGAFDTGPGNGPIDDWVSAHGHGRYDQEGALAAAGKVDEARIVAALAGAVQAGVPRSLDRADWTMAHAAGLGAADGAATLTALTAETIARAVHSIPFRPALLLVTGGGRRNPVLMEMIAGRAAIPANPVEQHGLNGDALEAQAFAWLAQRHMRGLPLSWPETTGVPTPATGGRLSMPVA